MRRSRLSSMLSTPSLVVGVAAEVAATAAIEETPLEGEEVVRIKHNPIPETPATADGRRQGMQMCQTKSKNFASITILMVAERTVVRIR